MSETTPSVDPARQIADLTALLEVSRQLGATTELGPLLVTVERACLRVLDCERATIFLFDPTSDELVSRVATGSSGEIRFPASRGIAGEILRTGGILNVPDAYADPRFNPDVDRRTGFKTRNLLGCPLLGIEGSPVGVLQVLNKHGGSFSGRDEELAGAFAAQAGVAVQRQLLLDAFAARQRMLADLELARSIQQQLLPSAPPRVNGFDLAGWNRPADETGGDFFDFQELPGGLVALTLADVTGHGIGPALLAAECRALFRASLAHDADLDRVVPRVNVLLAADVPSDRFVTAFVGLLMPEQGCCRYVSAGQGPLLHFETGTGRVRELRTSGPPLGLMADMSFESAERVEMAAGDLLLVCSDGFIEGNSPSDEAFGNDRLHDLVRRHASLPAAALIGRIAAALDKFTAGGPQQDDLTMVVVRKL